MLSSAVAGAGPFFILLGLLIFVHELGHFLVAKYFGVRVEVFSLGFGKKILQYKRGDTVYCISIIPLGGYVKMYGDDPSAEIPAEEKKFSFLHKPVWPRIAIVLAGPLMNLFFAIFLFAAIGGVGEELPAAVVGDLSPQSKAYEIGFRPGDRIVKINGEEIASWIQARELIEASGGKTISVSVQSTENGQPLMKTFDTVPSFEPNDNIFSLKKNVGRIPGLDINARSTLVGIANPNSLAAQAGLQSLDLITSANGKKLTSWRELQAALGNLAPGSKIDLEAQGVEAPGNQATRKVTITLPNDWNSGGEALSQLGIESGELYVYKVKPKSPAEVSGLLPKDKLVRVNSTEVTAWNDVIEQVKSYDPNGPAIQLGVIRDGEEKTFELRPEMTALMNLKGQEEQRFTIGIQSGFLQVVPETVFYRISNPVEIARYGFQQAAQWTGFVVMSLVRLVQGDVSARNIGGVITIGRVASHSFSAGLSAFLKTMAIISINLFLLNLLPVPILDGGHLVFFSIEALRGAPLSMRKMEIAQQVGLMLLMFLMIFAFFNDISNLLSPQW